MVARYRMADHTERQQLSGSFLALVGRLRSGSASRGTARSSWIGPGRIGLTVYAFAAAGVPVAIAIAILRHNLYDIDRIVSRTIAYASSARSWRSSSARSSSSLDRPFDLRSGSDDRRGGSTLAAFAVFQPVLRRVRRDVDSRFDRARYDANQTVADFSDRLRDEIDMARP